MKIALIGGTGSFGTALAVRLRAAGYDVVIGSRDAERAQAAAAELGGAGRVDGATNEDAARAADLVVLTTKADGAVETARSLREAIGTTPVLSVAAELSFTKEGVLPTGRGDVDRGQDPGRARRARDRRPALARRLEPRRRRGARRGHARLRRRRRGQGARARARREDHLGHARSTQARSRARGRSRG